MLRISSWPAKRRLSGPTLIVTSGDDGELLHVSQSVANYFSGFGRLRSWGVGVGMASHVLSNGLSSLYCGLRSSRLELLLRTGASRTSFSRVGLRIREYVLPARYLAAAEASGAVNDGFFVENMVSSSYVTRFSVFCSSCPCPWGERFVNEKTGGRRTGRRGKEAGEKRNKKRDSGAREHLGTIRHH